MRGTVRVVACAAALLVSGCGGASGAASGGTTPEGGAPTPTATERPPSQATRETPAAFVEARASGASEEEAQRLALEALGERLLGDARAVYAEVHDPARDPRWVEPTEGGVSVWLGLSEERVREVLERVEATPAPSLPPPLATLVSALYRATLQRIVCERRRALFAAECEPADVQSLARQLGELGARVRLRPAHEGGVPVDSDGRPMRDAVVVVEQAHADGEVRPVPGIPIVARAEPGGPVIARGSTDQEGRAALTVERDRPLTAPLRVAIDRGAWLGPVAEHWPEREVRLAARPRDIRRWTAVVRERVSGRPSSERAFADGLFAAMRSQGARSPVALEDHLRDRLLAMRRDARAEVLPGLADTWEGRVDYVLVGDVESEFASRMGQNRVWYEARGRLEAIDAWSGHTVAVVEASVTAPGLGDDRAAQAAHRALADRLARELVEELRGDGRVASATPARR